MLSSHVRGSSLQSKCERTDDVRPATELHCAAGYRDRMTDGAVRWTYPIAAEDEVRALRASQAQRWRRIVARARCDSVDDASSTSASRSTRSRCSALRPRTTSPLPGYATASRFRSTA